MEVPKHPAASHHVPSFITAPGDSDWLMTLMAIVLIGGVLGTGIFFFWLHSLPERMVHNKVQFDIVAALGLLSLFTHIHAFWVAALIIALIEFPKFSLTGLGDTLGRMAGSLETMADAQAKPDDAKSLPPAGPQPAGPKPVPSKGKSDSPSTATRTGEPALKRGGSGHA
jgi:hypothetical protein